METGLEKVILNKKMYKNNFHIFLQEIHFKQVKNTALQEEDYLID